MSKPASSHQSFPTPLTMCQMKNPDSLHYLKTFLHLQSKKLLLNKKYLKTETQKIFC